MDSQPQVSIPEEMTRHEPANQEPQHHHAPKQPGYLLVAWILLLLLGAFFLFASVSDLVADGRAGLPSDHLEAFQTIAGVTWTSAKLASPHVTQYVTLLEVTYAVHELVFGLLFVTTVAGIVKMYPGAWVNHPLSLPREARRRNEKKRHLAGAFRKQSLVRKMEGGSKWKCSMRVVAELMSTSVLSSFASEGREQGYRTKELRRFGTMTGDLLRLQEWLLETGCTHVAM